MNSYIFSMEIKLNIVKSARILCSWEATVTTVANYIWL